MSLTDSQKRATAKYFSKLDDIRLRVPKGTKARWRDAADAEGKSLTQFIIDCVDAHTPPDAPEGRTGA